MDRFFFFFFVLSRVIRHSGLQRMIHLHGCSHGRGGGRVAAAGPAVGGPSHLAKACMQSCLD